MLLLLGAAGALRLVCALSRYEEKESGRTLSWMSLHKSPWYLSLKGKTLQEIGMERVEWIELLPNFMARKQQSWQSMVPPVPTESVGRIKNGGNVDEDEDKRRREEKRRVSGGRVIGFRP